LHHTATLHDHACGKAQGLGKGPEPVLTLVEEQALEDWLVEMASIGYGRTKQQLRQSVKEILEKEKRQNPFTDNMPGRKWVWYYRTAGRAWKNSLYRYVHS